MWQKVSQRSYPYNAVARQEDGLMKINGVAASAAANTGNPTVLYSPFYGVEGNHPQHEMKHKFDLLTKDLRVSEH
jgi:hypothetical protein